MIINKSKMDDYLEFQVLGKFELNESIEKFNFIIDECSRERIQKALIDYHELEGGAEGLERTLYAYGIEEHYLRHIRNGGKQLKFAFIGNSFELTNQAQIYAEITKFPAKLFDDKNSAVKWLNEGT